MPPEQLDQDAVNLAKAIRQTESGGNFNAKGKSGEYGAYQYTKGTWDKDAKSFGVNVQLEQATPEQQNEVAYKKIKSLKDQGYNPGQIASIWNSGKPDAYLDTSYTGTNKSGVHYDVPAYAKSVATAYQTIKAGGQAHIDPQNPSSTANTTPVQPPQKEQNPFPSQMPGREENVEGLKSLSGAVSSIFPGQKIGQAIGTLGGYLTSKNKEEYDLSAPTPLQVAGDTAQAALLVAAPNVTGSSGRGLLPALGRIGTNTALGGGLGVSHAVAEGKTDIKEIGKEGLIGATTGGALSTGGELIGAATRFLPERVAHHFLKGANDETVKYATSKGLGTPTKMLDQSEASLNELGKKLDATLSAKTNSYVQPNGEELFNSVAQQFPDAALTPQEIVENLKKLVPLKRGLIDKVVAGNASLKELHTLNSAVGRATYKMVFDDPTVKAGKEIGNAFYHTVSDFLKQAAPDSAPIFDDFTKELQLNSALVKLLKKTGNSKILDWPTIMALVASSPFGPMAMAGAVGLEKLTSSPSAMLGTAGLVSRVPQASGVAQGLLPYATRGVLGSTSK